MRSGTRGRSGDALGDEAQIHQLQSESLHILAAKAGVHFTTIVRIERGRLSPTVEILEKLAKALDLHITDHGAGCSGRRSSKVQALVLSPSGALRTGRGSLERRPSKARAGPGCRLTAEWRKALRV
jgi:transcriptional regulator with XRE-family HTH domain